MKQLLFYTLLLTLTSTTMYPAQKAFMLGGWVPYWRSELAMATLKKHQHLFDQISPFSYEVDAQGRIKNPFRRKRNDWHELYTHFKKRNCLYVPTIFWTTTTDMHIVFSNKGKRDNHIKQIMDIVIQNQFDGININYEKVCSHDRDGYLIFLEQLSQELHKRGLVLYISIGGRTGDNTIGVLHPSHKPKAHHGHTDLKYHDQKHPRRVHVSMNPGKGADAIRYKRILSQCCDQVHIMGYDEWARPFKHSKEARKIKYYFSHASNQWVEQIIQYALTFIPAHKVVLGVPTYGLEFAIYPQSETDFKFKKRRNVNYIRAMELALTAKKKPQRTPGGELCFTYRNSLEERYVCFLDKQAVSDKIDLVKKYKIKGMYIFTVNGNEDCDMWSLIEKELHGGNFKKPSK